MQQCLLLKRNVSGDTRPHGPCMRALDESGTVACPGTGMLMQLLIAAKARSPHKEIRQQSFSLLGAR